MTQWISVEKLPTKSKRYLTFKTHIYIQFFDLKERNFHDEYGHPCREVKYWAELPEPPTIESSKNFVCDHIFREISDEQWDVTSNLLGMHD